jgi:rhodanese-related sulfurtransferase
VSFLAENWFLIVTALLSGGLLLWPMVKDGGGASKVTPAEAVSLINRERGVLIDVSEPAEFAAGRAGGSKNIPFGSLDTSNDLPKNKTVPVLLVCPTGARANRAVALLRKRGYEKTVSVGGGLAAWREANLPVERST